MRIRFVASGFVLLAVGAVAGAVCGWAYWWVDEITLRTASLQILFFPGVFFACSAGLLVRRIAEGLGDAAVDMAIVGGLAAGVAVLYFGGHPTPEEVILMAKRGHLHAHAEGGHVVAVLVHIFDSAACFLSAVMASLDRLPGDW